METVLVGKLCLCKESLLRPKFLKKLKYFFQLSFDSFFDILYQQKGVLSVGYPNLMLVEGF